MHDLRVSGVVALQDHCISGIVVQHSLHNHCISGIVVQDALHNHCISGIVAQDALHESLGICDALLLEPTSLVPLRARCKALKLLVQQLMLQPQQPTLQLHQPLL
jgi:hypothetical protein